MRSVTLVLLCLVIVVTLAAIPSGEGLVDIVTFHRYAPDGPIAAYFNEGETVFVNITDGRTRGGSKQYYVYDGNGTRQNLVCWDNANNVDQTARDGYYSGAFTPYESRTPSTYHSKIHFDGSGNYTVVADLDGRGSTTITFWLWVRPFELSVWSVVENSPYVYFNNATKVLYYSNDQAFSAAVDVRLKDTKPSADDKTCGGEAAFGSIPSDTDYFGDRHWDMWYTINQGEVCDGNLTFWATDNQHCTANANLTVVLDNEGPVVEDVRIADPPDHVGTDYDWWRPSAIPGGTLNVTWWHEDEAGPMSATLDWDSTVGANDQFGIDPGLDMWELVGGLNDDGSCYIHVTVTVIDMVSNPGSGSCWAAFDQDAPAVTSVQVVEDADNVHFDGSTLIYSNDQLMADLFEFVVADDEDLSGRSDADGSVAFGNAPTDGDYVGGGGWNLQYIVHMGETSGPITISVRDNVGNVGTAVVPTLLDNTAPSVTAGASEGSPWLYIDGTIYFGDGMPSAQELTVFGTAADPSGVWRAEFTVEPNLALSPPTSYMNGTEDDWSGTYGIDAASTPGDGLIVVRVFDTLGNMNSATLTYVRDTIAPHILPFNYEDGTIVNDMHDLLLYGSPWSVLASAEAWEDITALYRVNVSIDDLPQAEWILPRAGVFNVTSAMVNWTGWHVITWQAADSVNNTRVTDTSVLRAPNSTDHRLRRRLDPIAPTLVDASADPTFSASISMAPTQAVWASVMDYPLNPITGRPAGNYTDDPNRNYTTFHYLDVGVNRTRYSRSATVRLYYTEADISALHLEEEAIIGLARWDGGDWHWLTSSVVSNVNQTIGFRLYSGYVEATVNGLYNRSNIIAIAGWRHRVKLRDDLCDTNATIFREGMTNSYQRTFSISFKNIGSAPDDYYLNATGPNDWKISWVEGHDERSTIRSAGVWENGTALLYVVIPFGAENVSAGTDGLGIAYDMRVTIGSMTDRTSTANPWRSDAIDLTGFIRRTDLEVATVTFDRYAYLEEQEVVVFVEIFNHGNYTTMDAVVAVTMYAGGVRLDLGSDVVPAGALEPLESFWLIFTTVAPEDVEEMTFTANVTYGGDERDVEPNVLTASVDVVQPRVSSSTGLPAVAALALAALAVALRARREDDDR